MSHPDESRKADEILTSQLDQAHENEHVEAVFRLRAKGTKLVPTAEETVKLVEEVLGRAEAAAGEKAQRSHVFKHMGSFVVSAKPTLIKALLEQPEVAKATANRHETAAAV